MCICRDPVCVLCFDSLNVLSPQWVKCINERQKIMITKYNCHKLGAHVNPGIRLEIRGHQITKYNVSFALYHLFKYKEKN